MNPWNILGIDPTSDSAAIKKAYAKMLRLYHPEDDPQGYQRLREAYDFALKTAKGLKPAAPEVQAASVPEDAYTGQLEEEGGSQPEAFLPPARIHVEDHANEAPEPHTDDIVPPERIHIEDPKSRFSSALETADGFMAQVEALYQDFLTRIEHENWKLLLDRYVTWNIDNRKVLGVRILEFLARHHYLPQETWRLLSSAFSWFEQGAPSQEYLDYANVLTYIQYELQQKDPLGFTFKPEQPFDYDNYLMRRENAQLAFLQGNLEKMREFIDAAKQIYEKDPDLLCLEAKFFLLSDRENEAIEVLNRLLEDYPEHEWALLYRAVAMHVKYTGKRTPNKAAPVFPQNPNNKEIPFIIAKAYFNIGHLNQAKTWLHKAIRINPQNAEALTLFFQVCCIIRDKLNAAIKLEPRNRKLRKQLTKIGEDITKNVSMRKRLENKRLNRALQTIYLAVLAAFILLYLVNQNVQNHKIKNAAEPVAAENISDSGTHEPMLTIIDSANISTVPINDKKILVTLTELVGLPYYRVNDDHTSEPVFIPNALGDEQDEKLSVYAGKLDSQLIVFCKKPDSMFNIYISSNRPVTLEGTMCGNLSEKVSEYVTKVVIREQSDIHFVSDRYVLVENDLTVNFPGSPPPNDETDTTFIGVFIYMGLIGIVYVAIRLKNRIFG